MGGVVVRKSFEEGTVLRSRKKRWRRDVSDKSSGDSDTMSSMSSTMSMHQEEDAVTNWGVLVGKALWCYMKGPGQVGQRASDLRIRPLPLTGS